MAGAGNGCLHFLSATSHLTVIWIHVPLPFAGRPGLLEPDSPETALEIPYRSARVTVLFQCRPFVLISRTLKCCLESEI